MAEYINALMICLQPINLLLIIAMVALGIVFGAIPGLSATLGIALLLPVTFGLSTETSFVLLLAIWIGGVSGTFISAVLIGIPGSSSAIATCFDGFPMTKNGQAGKALGIGMTASFIGTVGSVALATVLSPVIAEFALHLGPWEYFSLCFCAITLVASLSKGNIFKGIMAAGIGLLMGCMVWTRSTELPVLHLETPTSPVESARLHRCLVCLQCARSSVTLPAVRQRCRTQMSET